MARTKISEFSATPGNNTDIDSINIAEGCAPSGINDAIRELMAQLKDFQTGAVGDSFNGPVGTTTAAAGAFTTLSASSTVSGTGFSTYLASPPSIGSTTAAAGAFTTLAASSTLGVTGVSTLTGGGIVQGLTVGRGAGAVATNTAVGASALAVNTTGASNTAFGDSALAANTTGSNNQAFGRGALSLNVDGGQNVAVGRLALGANTSGPSNSAVGHTALSSNTTGSFNVAVGQSALGANTTSPDNTAVGYQAGYAVTTGGYNTFVGALSGANVTTGVENQFFGRYAGQAITTGSKNTIIGKYSGVGGTPSMLATYSNWIVLSDGDANGRAWYSGAWYQANNSASWSTVSDQRIKENIAPITNGLDVINALSPCSFNYKRDGQFDEGFIAQEYEQVLPHQVSESEVGGELAAMTGGEPLKNIQQNLVPYLVASIKEQQAIITALTARVTALESNP